ncbi:MAG: S-methyl-5-thioribose-1-phosphate isomerase [Lentisphaerae bacterium GWF2_45_14]|nr:MAG: S-methyl-5-thioribose-1-phosphate isomerase [Lentisphaerae bacterium GWF2_45_14]
MDDDGRVYDKFEDCDDIFSGKLRLIDQTLLPVELKYLQTDKPEEIFDFIKRLVVRGAPAIGCAAALGLAASSKHFDSADRASFLRDLEKISSFLASSRPTAVNLFWALNRCADACRKSELSSPASLRKLLLKEALSILEEDIDMCRAIGNYGSALLENDFGVLTHCNAGALATGDYGTALSPVYVAHEKGIKLRVYSDETRPLLQGSRLTAWELDRAGVDVTTICDNMAAQLMKEGKVNIVIVGADRVAANGDAANKIGTYGVAILAKYHKIPFYVAIPYSTVDSSLKDGSLIPIEQRHRDEVARGFGKVTAPDTVKIYNPAFDVTPNELITGFITERGIIEAPFLGKL